MQVNKASSLITVWDTLALFQAGVDRKLVKEFSEHSSDAVDAYHGENAPTESTVATNSQEYQFDLNFERSDRMHLQGADGNVDQEIAKIIEMFP